MTVGAAYLTMRRALRKDMASGRKAGQGRMMWPVTDVSRLTGLTIKEIEYTFQGHETHLKRYVLVYDPDSRTLHWNE